MKFPRFSTLTVYMDATTIVGQWYTGKARRNAQSSGIYQAARNLKKQGVPLEIARIMLCGRAG